MRTDYTSNGHICFKRTGLHAFSRRKLRLDFREPTKRDVVRRLRRRERNDSEPHRSRRSGTIGSGSVSYNFFPLLSGAARGQGSSDEDVMNGPQASFSVMRLHGSDGSDGDPSIVGEAIKMTWAARSRRMGDASSLRTCSVEMKGSRSRTSVASPSAASRVLETETLVDRFARLRQGVGFEQAGARWLGIVIARNALGPSAIGYLRIVFASGPSRTFAPRSSLFSAPSRFCSLLVPVANLRWHAPPLRARARHTSRHRASRGRIVRQMLTRVRSRTRRRGSTALWRIDFLAALRPSLYPGSRPSLWVGKFCLRTCLLTVLVFEVGRRYKASAKLSASLKEGARGQSLVAKRTVRREKWRYRSN